MTVRSAPSQGPCISVICSNLNGARFLPRLLQSLRDQRGVRLEIIVVDRNSQDESLRILQDHPEVRVVPEPPESGLVTGYTVGLRHAAHDLVYFCNEDMWFAPDCLRLLAQAIDLDTRVGAADPWQWSYDGEHWIHGCTRFRPTRLNLNSAWPFVEYDFTVPASAGVRVPFACAGAFLIHRRVFEQVGGWDTSFFLDAEDTDLGIRLWQNGWSTVVVPGAKVFHAVGASNGHNIGPTGSVKVSRRRYISSNANKAIIGLKYYSAPYLSLPVGTWVARFANNALKGRRELLVMDIEVLREIARRLPDAVAWRLRHREENRAYPGERFFRDPTFLADPHADAQPS